MFENLLFQEEAAGILSKAAKSGRLPPAMLFQGPFASGKTTAALELARAVSCRRGADWNCPCGDCERHRRCSHPDILLAGNDSFGEELSAAVEGLTRAAGRRELYAFLRAVRRLTRRFDPELWEGDESKLAKAAPGLAAIEELLPGLDPSLAPLDAGKAVEAAGRIAEEAVKLIDLVPAAIPISQVRNAIRWIHLSPSARAKVLLLENAENMLEAARNAILKLLEEPPQGALVILTSTRRSALLETILSRLRPVTFRERGPGASREVLKRVFGAEDSKADSVGAYLEGFRRPSDAELAPLAHALAGEALARAAATSGLRLPEEYRDEGGPEASIPEQYLERDAFLSLCRCLMSECGSALRGLCAADPASPLAAAAAALGERAREAAYRAQALNISPSSLARWLWRGAQAGP